MAAISPEVEEVSIKLRKFAKYFLKVYPFARAQKIQGVALKSRHGNTHFNKIRISIISYSRVVDGWLGNGRS